jgi:hypothetical protein
MATEAFKKRSSVPIHLQQYSTNKTHDKAIETSGLRLTDDVHSASECHQRSLIRRKGLHCHGLFCGRPSARVQEK